MLSVISHLAAWGVFSRQAPPIQHSLCQAQQSFWPSRLEFPLWQFHFVSLVCLPLQVSQLRKLQPPFSFLHLESHELDVLLHGQCAPVVCDSVQADDSLLD
jgi:hypothetical protein